MAEGSVRVTRIWRVVVTVLLVGALGPLSMGLAAGPSGQSLESRDGGFFRNGQPVLLRGINLAHTWHSDKTGRAIGDIARFGANSVRIVLATGHLWPRTTRSEVASIIRECRTWQLICMLEVHDTTGWGEQEGTASLDEAVDYWISLREELIGHEGSVAINIANEPFGNDFAVNEGYVAATQAAIGRMRSAGFGHLLVVDGPNWGQDWQFIMRDHAREIVDADRLGNTALSIHMYGNFVTAEQVRSYFDALERQNVPYLVGEFGIGHGDLGPDTSSVFRETAARRIGYFAWSWSGNSDDVAYLDIVSDFDPKSLTPWGRQLHRAMRDEAHSTAEGRQQ